jgi:hypothetical protein
VVCGSSMQSLGIKTLIHKLQFLFTSRSHNILIDPYSAFKLPNDCCLTLHPFL